MGILTAGCGGGPGADELDDTLAYFPDDAGVAVVINTDFEGDQVERLDRKIVRPQAGGRSLEDLLREGARDLDLSFDEDIKPLLGNELAIGTQSADDIGRITAAIRVDDAGKLRDV